MPFIRNLTTALVSNEARKRGKGNGLMGFGLGLIAARIATRSIPGALLVGGVIVAKALYSRSKERDQEGPASKQVIDIEEKPVQLDSVAEKQPSIH
ncbi:hypothetical protein [Parasphingorhabdus sp.]|uniref:hypothetical protein n=1 Tax=Parasphingorhabdus sp. TaxID=2709688 RepID=UPI002F93FFD6